MGGKKETLRRIVRPESDLFDSDNSSDEDKSKSKVEDSDVKHLPNDESVKPKKENDPGSELTIQSLTALSEMFDTFSYSDAYLSSPSEIKEGKCCRHTQEKWGPGRIISGMSDERTYCDERSLLRSRYSENISTELNCSILNITNTKLKHCVQELSHQPAKGVEDIKHRLSIPVPHEKLNQIVTTDISSQLTR